MSTTSEHNAMDNSSLMYYRLKFIFYFLSIAFVYILLYTDQLNVQYLKVGVPDESHTESFSIQFPHVFLYFRELVDSPGLLVFPESKDTEWVLHRAYFNNHNSLSMDIMMLHVPA